MEAVDGPEQLDVTAANLSTLPYTRNEVGSMDCTPMGFQTGNRPVTDAGELALSVVSASGFQNFAGSPEEYAERPNWGASSRRYRPSGTRRSCWPVSLARRRPSHGNGERWFLGGVTSGEGRAQHLSTGFPGQGSWTVDVVRDGPDRLVRESHTVRAGETREVPTPENGGLAALAHPA